LDQLVLEEVKVHVPEAAKTELLKEAEAAAAARMDAERFVYRRLTRRLRVVMNSPPLTTSAF
jgi:hypothetical protein